MSTKINVNSARKIAEIAVYMAFLGVLGGWISPVGAFEIWVADTSGDITGLYVLLTDFYVVAGGIAVGIAYWEQRPRRIPRLQSKIQEVAVILLILAGVSVVATGIFRGNQDPYAEARLFAYGASALLMPWIFNSRTALHRLVGVLISAPVLTILINPDFREVLITAKAQPWVTPTGPLVLSSSLAFGVGIVAGLPPWIRKLALLCFAVSAIALFMNVQRGGIVGFTAGVLIIASVYLFRSDTRKMFRSLSRSPFVLIRRKPWSALPLIVIFVSFMALMATLSGTIIDTQSERFNALRSPRNNPSTAYRLAAIEVGFNWWKESPLFGKGAGFETVWDVPYRPPGRPFEGQTELRGASLHNFFLRALLISGIVGAAAMLFSLGWAASRLIRAYRDQLRGNAPIVLGTLGTLPVSILVMAPSPMGADNMLILWITVGLAILPWALSDPDGIVSNRAESA